MQGTVKLKNDDFNIQMKIFYNFMLLVVHMAYKSGLEDKRLYNYIRIFNCANVFAVIKYTNHCNYMTVGYCKLSIDGIIYRNNSLMAK